MNTGQIELIASSAETAQMIIVVNTSLYDRGGYQNLDFASLWLCAQFAAGSVYVPANEGPRQE